MTTGSLKQLQAIATRNNIPIEKELDVIDEGWEGKPKGMFQILFERGFIDPAKPTKFYSLKGSKDAFGNTIVGSSLKELMESLIDFADEETLLQYNARLMGVHVDRTPKCHPEMAGEGVEYSWGCAKGLYRRLPLKDKKSKEKFRESVRKCLSTGNIDKKQQRKFSRRAREYMLAYRAIEQQQATNNSDNENNNKIEMSRMMIEKIIKKYKCHRSAETFDRGFIDAIVSKMKVV